MATPTPTQGDLKTGAQNMRVMLWFILAGFATTFALCVSLESHLRYRRRTALQGSASAATKIVLPAFEPLLVLLAVVNGAYVAFLVVTLSTGFFLPKVPPLALESCYSGNQFVFVIVLIMLMQKSLSRRALARSAAIALLLSTYSIPYLWYAITSGGDARRRRQLLIGHIVVRGGKYLLFVYAIFRPPHRATKRAIREFCLYALIHYALTVAHMLLIVNQSTIPIQRYVMYTNLTWVALAPLVIWRVLRADTDYWRGLGQRAGDLQQILHHKPSIQEIASAQGLHALIEAHLKYVIDFAYLRLEVQIGAGSTSNVFRGTLKAKSLVAVKVYTPERVTEKVLDAFSHEAAMCAALRHPNVVSFVGMCVAPPAVCLVFELCQGNLDDVMCAHAQRKYHPLRQQMLINVGYMLDAARAMAYLHSFSPPILHCDIQPANFLVDMECTVKLADFGESRGLATLKQGSSEHRLLRSTLVTDGDEDAGKWSGGPMEPTDSAIDRLWQSSTETGARQGGASVYMAPEIARSNGTAEGNGEAADVYALGVTMWDILYPFANHFRSSGTTDAEHHDQLGRSERESAPAALDQQVPVRLRDLINAAVQRDPRRRPTAQCVVSVLEEVQRELGVDVASRMMLDLQQFDDPVHTDTGRNDTNPRLDAGMLGAVAVVHRFTGALAADRMVDRNYVSSSEEAVRMGSAFMDAGLLHHATHSRRFESSGELFFFDNAAALFRHSISSGCDELMGPGQTDDPRRQSKSRASCGPYHVPDTGIPMLVSSRAPSSQSSRASLVSGSAECGCRKLARQAVAGGGQSVRARLGLDYLRTRRHAAPITEIVCEDTAEVDFRHEFAGLQDDDNRRKARFAS